MWNNEFILDTVCRYKERPGLPQPVEDLLPIVEKTGGPATDRLASLKAAFRSQYNQVYVFPKLLISLIWNQQNLSLEW